MNETFTDLFEEYQEAVYRLALAEHDNKGNADQDAEELLALRMLQLARNELNEYMDDLRGE